MAHSLRTQILTPTGPTALADIKVGDTVLDAVGGRNKVVKLVDGGVQELILLTSSDNYSVEVTENQSVSMYLAEADDVKVKDAMQALPEQPVVIPPLTEPVDYDVRSTEPLNPHPYLLGLMLQEQDPLHGYVSLTPDPKDLYQTHMPLPEMVAADGDTYKMVYSREWLTEVGVEKYLEEAGLLSGGVDKFNIPRDYLYAQAYEREALLRSFLPPTISLNTVITPEDMGQLPLDHPTLGESLKFLTYSIGWVPQPLRTYTMANHTWRYEDVRNLELENPENGYLVTGMLPMRYLP